jgi:uncharacterized protein YbaR (Trm112 family)
VALSPDLLEILRCPEARTPVALAEADLVEKLNAAIAGGGVKNKGGETVTEKVDGALLREDGQLVYPVRDDIPVMLIEEAILLEPLGLAG